MKKLLILISIICSGCTVCARQDTTLECEVRDMNGKCLYWSRSGTMLANKFGR